MREFVRLAIETGNSSHRQSTSRCAERFLEWNQSFCLLLDLMQGRRSLRVAST